MKGKTIKTALSVLLILMPLLTMARGLWVSSEQEAPKSSNCGQGTSGEQPPDTLMSDTGPEIKPGDIVCEISAKKTNYVVGESPAIEVRLRNKTNRTIRLVGCLDGSDLGWRFPHCVFEVDGPPGHRGPGIGRCGNTNALRAEDFVDLRAGESLNPFMRIDDYGFFGSSALDFTHFMVPGKYTVRFRYSTNSSKILEWVGIAGPPAKDSAVARLFPEVAKFETTSNSIELTFAPRPDGIGPGQQASPSPDQQ